MATTSVTIVWVLALIEIFDYHYCEQEKASIATYRDGLMVGEWWMPDLPTRQGIFDVIGIIFGVYDWWCGGSPN